MKNCNNNTFVKITNKDIFEEVQSLKKDNQKRMDDLSEKIDFVKEEITSRQDVTNGKVKNTKWIATTAMTVGFLVVGLLFEHLLKK